MKTRRRRNERKPLQQDLFASPAEPVHKLELPVLQQRHKCLWLCVAFPDLPLEAVAAETLQASQSVAVVQQLDGRLRVVAANPAAIAAGVSVGLPVNAALALVPQLIVHARNAHAEAVLLESLVSCCRLITPVVSVASESTLLLEVQGSLALFGGLQPLLAVLRREFAGLRLAVASSPVAQASLWLIQAGAEAHLQDVLDSRLRALPVSCLGWPEPLQRKFSRIGVTTLGDCLRLPRDGFAKRFGVAQLQELDRGFARAPDLRVNVRETEQFDSLLELPIETVDYSRIAVVLELQLNKLAAFLRQQQLVVQRFRISLLQREFMVGEGSKNTQTDVEMGLLDAQPAIDGLAELIALRFERIQLTAPVHAVQLQTIACFALSAMPVSSALNAADIFAVDTAAAGVEHVSATGLQLIERLRQRLGYQRVYSLALKADYRPERAWKKTEPLSVADSAGSYSIARRPLWLLQQPQALSAPAALAGHPERIQSGWWDSADVQRDYFQWQPRSGQRCWVYRDKAGWYLHGLFG